MPPALVERRFVRQMSCRNGAVSLTCPCVVVLCCVVVARRHVDAMPRVGGGISVDAGPGA